MKDTQAITTEKYKHFNLVWIMEDPSNFHQAIEGIVEYTEHFMVPAMFNICKKRSKKL